MRRLFVLCLSLLVVASLAVSAGADEPRVSGRLLVPGARLPGGAWGIDFDQADHLWVGNLAARQITELNANTGRILARFGPDQGVEGADDVAVGPDGAVYYTAIMTGEVGRIGPDGAHSTVVNLGPGVNPITFSDDGRLFVGRLLMDVGLFEVYLDGVTPPREIIPDIATNGFGWWDGYLYAPRPFNGDVVKIDVETGAFTTVVSGLTLPGGRGHRPRRAHVRGGRGNRVRVRSGYRCHHGGGIGPRRLWRQSGHRLRRADLRLGRHQRCDLAPPAATARQ